MHFTFNLPSCKSTNWVKPRMWQKPLAINATYICHILIFVYTLARPTEVNFQLHIRLVRCY